MPRRRKPRNRARGGRSKTHVSKHDKDVPKDKKVDVSTSSVVLFKAPKVYSFVQVDNFAGTIIGSTASSTAGAYYFELAGLSNASSFQSLFDQYRVYAIDFVLRPRCLSTNVTAASTSPPMYFVIDYDNSTALGSAAAAMQYSTCAVIESFESMRRVIQPRIAVAAYSGLFNSYANTTGWIDSASPSVIHYCFKWFIPQAVAGAVPEWDVISRVYLQFRNVI